MDNEVKAFRLQNFMGFVDSNWIKLPPLVLLFGRNSTGKSAILRALLLLKQSVNSHAEFGPFVLASEYGTDVGEFHNLVYNHDVSRNVSFAFEIEVEENWFHDTDILSSWFHLSLEYGVIPEHTMIVLKSLEISALINILNPKTDEKEDEERVLFKALRNENSEDKYPWSFSSNYFGEDEFKYPEAISLELFRGFIPFIVPSGVVDETGDLLEMGSAFSFAKSVLKKAEEALTTFFASLRYVGPIRSEPQRYYYVPQRTEARVGSRGESTVRSFLSANSEKRKRLEQINTWLRSTRLNSELKVEPISSNQPLYMVNLKEIREREQTPTTAESESSEFFVNIKDVGFGVSQAFPVMVESLLAESNSTVLVEQPELHLHPAAQAELGDLFLKSVEFGTRFVIETHSENLLNRLRRRMAEAALATKQKESPDFQLSPEKFTAYFIDRSSGVSTCEEITYDEWGKYDHQPEGFIDFFGNDFAELIALDDARMEAEKDK
jgi:predicted ATPase